VWGIISSKILIPNQLSFWHHQAVALLLFLSPVGLTHMSGVNVTGESACDTLTLDGWDAYTTQNTSTTTFGTTTSPLMHTFAVLAASLYP
jgi:hypothetical protein